MNLIASNVDFQRKKHGFRFSRVEQVRPLQYCDQLSDGTAGSFQFYNKVTGKRQFQRDYILRTSV